MHEIIDEKTWQEINRVLEIGDRVELIRVKDGIKVIQIKRKEIKAISALNGVISKKRRIK